jgi:hypothetical protein
MTVITPPRGDYPTTPADVRLEPCWLSWVGAVTGCLKSLGVACDTADVAGQSGYAFRIHVHADLCPSGPTNFPWSTLLDGVPRLGRSTIVFHAPQSHTPDSHDDRTRRHCAAALDLAKRELAAGRPVVINGAYMPEFAIVAGVEGDEGEEHYRVESVRGCSGQPQPPIRFDDLDAPGGPYVLGFPTETDIPRHRGDREAMIHALATMNESAAEPGWGFGDEAFGLWAQSLETGKAAAFGNAYNTQCWAEARRLAEQFVGRVAQRSGGGVDGLGRAHAAFARCASHLSRVAELFPFPGSDADVKDSSRVREAVSRLRAAREADVEACKGLRAALANWTRA